jgi:hypothetical protein
VIGALLVLQLAAVGQEAPQVRGVDIPRVEGADVTIDGSLSEPVWARAAILGRFSQYLPVDGRPAGDSTTVLVWYAPTAIYFGVRAYQDSASIRATLADRDKIAADDYVEILLDTFNDRRQARLFGVNPLGVQADGTLRDAPERGLNFTSTEARGAYLIDLSPDYVYESRGRVTAHGYEIEVRIPFKTLRYQTGNVQSWGVNVIRHVQHSGHTDTWTPVLQKHASFLAQGGILQGLTDLRRGLVLDLNPEMTSTVAGAPGSDGWEYGGGRPEAGGNARWGITNNFTLNGTVNPDFSQVEADVAQLQYDPREALYYPEKRPFFLDGIELFQSPTQLIYTRRLVDPVVAAKFTGNLSGTNVAVLSGLDAKTQSRSREEHPTYNLLRVRRDVGEQDVLGVVYTDKIDGDDFNRVGAVDGNLVFAERYTLTFQGGASGTRTAGETRWAPMWYARLNRSGRSFGLSVTTRGVHPNFRAASGFLSRGGIVYAGISPRYTKLGEPGAALERFTGSILLDGRWDYDRFFDGTIPNDPRLHLNSAFTFRGGWQFGASVLLESFMYPPELYADYAIERATGGTIDTVPFVGTPRLYNLDVAVNVATPRFQTFSAEGFVIVGRDENFYEWAPANIIIGTVDVSWRPSEQLRVNLLYNHQQYIRSDDWSVVAIRRVPRLKVEYQLTRSIFLRFVGQYDSETVDSLRDNSRTDDPVLVWDADAGVFRRTTDHKRNDLRVDWLFSYRPTPGTVLFAGYGAGLASPTTFGFRELEWEADGFFLKLSYLFRL